MYFERNDYYKEAPSLSDQCRKYAYYHINLRMADGSIINGIIQEVSPDEITMLVSEDVMEGDTESLYNEHQQHRVFYGPRRGFRRFVPRTFPINSLLSLALVPYFIPPMYNYYY